MKGAATGLYTIDINLPGFNKYMAFCFASRPATKIAKIGQPANIVELSSLRQLLLIFAAGPPKCLK